MITALHNDTSGDTLTLMSSTTNPNPIPGCYNCDGTGHDEMMNCACDCQGWDAVKGTRTLAGAGMGTPNATREHVAGNGTGTGSGRGTTNKVATIAQVRYLRSLVEAADPANPVVIRAAAALEGAYSMPIRVASEWIEALKGEAALAATTAPRAAAESTTPAKVVPNRFGAKCARCGVWVAENAGHRAPRASGKGWDVFHTPECPQAAPVAPQAPAAAPEVDGIDLTPLAAYGTKQSTGATTVRFGVPGGDTRLKLRISFAPDGRTWVTDAAHYGERTTYGCQNPGAAYRGKVQDALRAILADPTAAAMRYAELTSTCASCGRKLEQAESVANGMGPICAGKFGM